jgi:phosphatidylglycerol:prolipoprotein diacylglycerol transferase
VIPDLFSIGSFTVHSFGLMAALALLLPAYFVSRDLADRGRDPVLAWEIALGAGIGGFLGARIDYLIQNDSDAGLFSGNGLVWWGGFIGGAIGVLAIASWRKLPWGVAANLAAPGVALAYAVGRIGCQLSGDGDYGSASSLPWAMSYPDGEVPTNEVVHPTPIYETATMIAAFWLLWRLRGRLDRPWQLFGLFLVIAGTERFLIEFIRRNDSVLAGLTTAQLIGLVLAVIGAAILVQRSQSRPARFAT